MSVEVRDTGASTRPRQKHGRASPGQVDAAIRGVGLSSAFQPIVALPDGTVVGFEALARWPASTGLGPQAVFAQAEALDRVDELDRLCIDTAITGALDHGLTRKALLCINCEPSSTMADTGQNELLKRGRSELQLMFELTERSLLAHPRALLAKVAALRGDGFGIALDDVGAHPDSLALLDVIAPDVVKLDMGLVQSQPDDAQARTLSAVLAHHERSGAVILAEGIETEEHLEQALAVGATLGQGYKFGRPGALDHYPLAAGWSLPVRPPSRAIAFGSPFDLVRDRATIRTGRKQTLTAFSRHIESQAHDSTDTPILLTALQHAKHFTGRTRRAYRDLAGRSSMVAVFGANMPADFGSGVRGVALESTDALAKEWTVLALGPHLAAALIAREHDDDGEETRRDGDRRFDFVITYDRAIVTAAACNLLARVP
ncbi:EAL domain-containing protein [Mycolicibacterium sp. P1-18]|uniref:sensor domain-containing phosphodiesterase n=1 Tax=Mycolicibacterium sp. P1-18 TaxID=2024615 RepID=UPI0011F3069E|nr:EAL domain-containing protein [Mycolicibacterium sp. P1-18]KAA0095980.1 EAL domain-containing protein [Mycolicibacterium sp. P1-18]